ncbi:MAG TPA: hypothetical protein VGE67_09870, partial [Haloferula sp.]
MLLVLVLLPLLAFVAMLAGAPARKAAIAAGVANLVLGLWAATSWQNEKLWSVSLPVLETPALHLSLGFYDGMSVIMVLLSVIVTLAALLSGKAPEGRETLYYG